MACVLIIPTSQQRTIASFKRFIVFFFMRLFITPYIGKLSRILLFQNKFLATEVVLELYFFLGLRLEILNQSIFGQLY